MLTNDGAKLKASVREALREKVRPGLLDAAYEDHTPRQGDCSANEKNRCPAGKHRVRQPTRTMALVWNGD